MSTPCGTVVPFGPRDAKIAVVIDAPCANDIWASRILSGGHGDSFFQMMQQAGMFKSACYFTSMFKYRIMGDNFERYATTVKKKAEENKLHLVADGLYCNEQMKQVAEALRQEILKLNPTVVVVLGPYSMWALTGEFGSIHTWRGSHLQCSFLPETTVIPTFDPYTLARQYDQRQYCIRDLLRANCVAKQPHLYREPRYDFTIAPSYSQVMGYLEESLREADEQEELWISCDIETIARYISCIGLGKNAREALCIPFMDIKGHYWSEEEEFAIQLKLQELLTHPNIRVIGQNFNYDAQHFAKELGYLPNLAFDTMLGYHALFPGLSKDLSMLSSLFCHWHRYWKDENKDYARLPANMAQYWRYNAKDVVITYEVSLGIRELLAHFGKEKQSADLHRFGQAALRSMLRGVRIDTTLRSHVAGQLMTAITEYQTLINKVAGEPLNTRSVPQMHKLFYGEFDLPVQLDRKTRRPTLGDDALTALMKIEPILKPFIELISMHRKLASFLKNYCQMPLSSDGRMRCSYNVAGTETYRFSSSQDAFGTGGNLQNLSTGTEDD